MAHPSAPVEFVWSWKRAAITAVSFVLIVGGYIAYTMLMSLNNPQARFRVVSERAYSVETLTLSAGDISQAIEASGNVQPARQVDLRPLVGGQVIYVNPNLRDGGAVSAGELLIEIDPANADLNLRQAQNALTDAQTSAARLTADVARQEGQVTLQRQQLRLAEAELARRQDLLDQGIITQAAFEQVQTSTLAQRQSLSGSANALAQLREQSDASATALDSARISVDLAAKSLADTKLTAPFDALVVLSNVQQGQLASQGDLAARLLDTAGLEVQFRLPADLFSRLSQLGETGLLGQSISVSWSGQVGSMPIEGVIVRQGSTFDASASGVPLFATLPPAAFDGGLRPGAFVTVALQGESFGQVYALPRDVYFEALGAGGGIYIIEEKPLVEVPEWQGPTSRASITKVNAWLAEQDTADVAALSLPDWLEDEDDSTVFADLYECKASHLVGENPRGAGRGGRPGGRGGNRGDERPGTVTTGEELAGDGPRGARGGETGRATPTNRPALNRDQSRNLCPLSSQTVAKAMPATLLSYAGDQALITGEGLEGQTAIIQAFDALANGTWLTLGDAQETAQ